MPSAVTLDDLRRYAVARTLFAPTTLARAIDRLAFVQADPIRAPARAQDLTLRHRVIDYRAGDLERKYPRLAIEEDFFVGDPRLAAVAGPEYAGILVGGHIAADETIRKTQSWRREST